MSLSLMHVLLLYFLSDQTVPFKDLSLPQDEDRSGRSSVMQGQHRSPPFFKKKKPAFPPGVELYKFDYCLDHPSESHHRMLLEVKPAQGKNPSQPAATVTLSKSRRLKRWGDRKGFITRFHCRFDTCESHILSYCQCSCSSYRDSAFWVQTWLNITSVMRGTDFFFFLLYF